MTPADIAGLSATNFKSYDYSSPPALREVAATRLGGAPVKHLGVALGKAAAPAPSPATTLNGAPITNAVKSQLEQEFASLTARLTQVDKVIADNQVVIREALDYSYR